MANIYSEIKDNVEYIASLLELAKDNYVSLAKLKEVWLILNNLINNKPFEPKITFPNGVDKPKLLESKLKKKKLINFLATKKETIKNIFSIAPFLAIFGLIFLISSFLVVEWKVILLTISIVFFSFPIFVFLVCLILLIWSKQIKKVVNEDDEIQIKNRIEQKVYEEFLRKDYFEKGQYKKYLKHKEHYYKNIDQWKEEFKIVNLRIEKLKEENEGILSFLPNKYQNESAVKSFLNIIYSLRANKLTDIINIYESDNNNQKLIIELQDIKKSVSNSLMTKTVK